MTDTQTAEFNSAAEFRDGVKDVLPVLVAIAPFGILFGAVATKAGFSIFETLLSSALIVAGASQFVMIDLLGQRMPYQSIIIAVLAVNFRHVIYSASISRAMRLFSPLQKYSAFFILVDPTYAAAETRAEKRPLTAAYYFGYGLVMYATWNTTTLLGAIFGSFIDDPVKYGIDFILPLYFTGLVMGFRERRFFWQILTISGIAALAAHFTFGSPWNIAAGGVAGMLLAAVLSKPIEEA